MNAPLAKAAGDVECGLEMPAGVGPGKHSPGAEEGDLEALATGNLHGETIEVFGGEVRLPGVRRANPKAAIDHSR